MSDVFISYATADREHARRLAKALERQGWTVWWDRTILPGSDWQAVIERALDLASCAVVLWSRNSVDSGWVRTEAEEARERGILVPACLDDVRIPLAFRRIQAASLVGWDGRPSHDGFRTLIQGISAIRARGAAPKAAASTNSVVEAAASNDGADAPARAVPVTQKIRFRVPKWPGRPAWTRSRGLWRVLAGVCVIVVSALLVRIALVPRPLRLALLTRLPTPKIPRSLSFSPDTKSLATLDDEEACAWNTETGGKIRCYGDSGYAVSWLDQKLLWLKSFGGDKVFDVSKDVFKGDKTTVLAGFSNLEISPDKKRVAFDTSTGSWFFADLPETGRSVEIWNIAERKESCTLTAGPSIRPAMNEWSPDGKYLATTVAVRTEVENPEQGAGLSQQQQIEGFLHPLRDATDLSSHSSSSNEKPERSTTRIWNTQTCERVRTSPRSNSFWFFTDCVDWRKLRLSSACYGDVTSPDRQYYLESGKIHRASDSSIIGTQFQGQFLEWGPKPDEFYVRSADNIVRVLSVHGAAPVAQLTLPFGIKGSITASRDRKTIAIRVYDPNSSIYVWNAEAKKLFPRIGGVNDKNSIRLERDGSLLMSEEGWVVAGITTLYDVATSRELARVQGPAFSSDGEYMAGILRAPAGPVQPGTSIWRISRPWW